MYIECLKDYSYDAINSSHNNICHHSGFEQT